MPRPRFQKLPKAKQDKMLEAAASEFSIHGYHGASLNHILEASGISKGAAYYYFDSKADLFATVISNYLSHIVSESGFNIGALTSDNFWAMSSGLWAQNTKHSAEMPYIPGLFKAAHGLSKKDFEEKPLKEAYEIIMQLFLGFLSKGRELGAIRSDIPLDFLAALAIGLDDGGDHWLLDNWSRFSKDELATYSRLHFDAMKRLLEPRKTEA